MADLPEAGAKLTLDLSEWERNWASAENTATSVMGDIPTEAEVDVTFTSSGEDAIFDDIPESTETEIVTTESEDTKKMVEGITFLAFKEKIELAMDIIGNVWDFFTKIEAVTVAPFLDVEDAVARINARTGGTGIEDLGDLIRELQFADLGESTDQIADVIIKAQQLALPIEEAATAALTFTHTWTEEDPSTVIGTLGTLVQTGLVDNLQEAADLMTVFFQQGGNVGGDALAVVEANAQAWADMGLSASEALSTVESLQQGTGATAGDAAKMIQTFDDALTAAAADPGSEQAKMLKLMGISNPKDQGEAIGAETIDGFASAFSNLAPDQQDLISGMFFGKGGKKFTGAIEGMTTQGGMFADVVGAAEEAAAAADDSLRGIIDDFVLKMNEEVSKLLSSESIDLPGKIEALKKGLQEAMDVLASGGTVGEAIEIGLNIPGFNDAVTRFEASIGNFAINVLEIIAGIQDFLGKDSSGTRAEITRMEANQLPFNLKVANPDEIAGELQTAVDRGLDTEQIADASTTAFNELVNSGEFEKAQALLDGLKEISTGAPMLAPGLGGTALQEAQVALRMAENGDMSRIQEQIDKGNLVAPVTVDTELLQQSLKEAIPPTPLLDAKAIDTDALNNALGFRANGVGASRGMTDWTKEFFGDSQQPGGIFGDAIKAFEDVQTTSETTMPAASEAVTTAKDEMVASMEGLALQAQIMDADIANAMLGNTVTTSFQSVADKAAETFPSVMDWFMQTAAAAATFDASVSVHFRSIMKQLNDINFLAQQTIGNVMQATGVVGGGGGTTNNTTNNVTVNNNVQGSAAASANGYAIAASLRPGGV